MNELMNTILHRRAIRRYEEAQIEEDVLQQIYKLVYMLQVQEDDKALYLLFLRINQ